jgi:tRNA A-37 threonylcarbamoyl transferase component Bud32
MSKNITMQYFKSFLIPTLQCQYQPIGEPLKKPIEDFLHRNIDSPQDSDTLKIIKSNHHTQVLRININQTSLIVKSFKMRRLRDSLQHSRRALAEHNNNLEAAKRGIRTPHLYAYFEKRRFGLVKRCGVVMEDVCDYTELRKLVLSGRRSCFDAIAILKELYLRGISHIDTSPNNILINNQNGSFAIIDWQYCSFYPQANDLSLCMMAAVFLRYTWMRPEDLLWEQWIEELFNTCRPAISLEKMKKSVGIMQNRKLHWTARLSLDFCGLGLEKLWKRA